MGTSLRSFAHPTSYMLLNLTSGEIQEYPCKTLFSPLFGPFPNTAGSDLCHDQVIIWLSPRIMNGKRQGVAYTFSKSSFRKPLSGNFQPIWV